MIVVELVDADDIPVLSVPFVVTHDKSVVVKFLAADSVTVVPPSTRVAAPEVDVDDPT